MRDNEEPRKEKKIRDYRVINIHYISHILTSCASQFAHTYSSHAFLTFPSGRDHIRELFAKRR